MSKLGIWFSLFFASWLTTINTAAAEQVEVPIVGVESSFLQQMGFMPEEAEDLNGIATQLRHFLEHHGYLLASVAAHDGALYVDLGLVTEIQTIGLGENTRQAAINYLIPALEGKHPIEDEMDHALMLIGDMPGVDEPAISFERSQDTGLYDALLTAQERNSSGAISFDSTPRKAFQRNRISLQQDFYHVLTGGDIFRFQGGMISGDGEPDQYSVYLSYQAPVADDGSYAEIAYADLESETSVRGRSTAVVSSTGFNIVPGAVTNHDYEGQTISLSYGHPLHRAHDYSHYLIGNLDYTIDDTSGVGETDSWVVDMGWFETSHSDDGVTSDFSIGVGFGTTDSYVDSEDGDFAHLQVGYGLIQPLGATEENMEMRIEVFGQLSTQDTPDARAFFLGSTDFLRGYESAALEGNSGLAGSLEIARGYLLPSDYAYQAVPYLFLDYGYVKNPDSHVNGTTKPTSDSLASVGLGSSFDFRSGLRLEGYVAKPLKEDSTGTTPSAAGYLKLTWGW